MKIIDNPKAALKSYSALALGAVTTVTGLWAAFPDEAKALIPADKLALITAGVAVLGFVGRFISQTKTPAPIDAPAEVPAPQPETPVEAVKDAVIDVAAAEVVKAIKKRTKKS
jgi:hypothetical protein